MHLLIAPVVITGLVLKIYNNSKRDILNRKVSSHSEYNNIKYLKTTDMGNHLHDEQLTQKRAVDF